ncbi:hypothetical protein POL25_36035 [Nannocystis sp. bb15-2]|uniref:Uncharacterized protein n=1 Tax=Nannocystis bainbridge TaxID=2995303 RepID=A0ABT5EC42_9BACT|nr:hypothetical protein [Nannocystis bainbridge]MDC0722356.1 hypothetical protein [Nannocystis bainbridge]
MDESMMTLRRLLAVHDEAIIDAGLAWVRQAGALDLAERPLAEARALVADSGSFAFHPAGSSLRISTPLRRSFAFHPAGSSPPRAAPAAAGSRSTSSSTLSPSCWAAPFTSTPRPSAALASTSASPPRPAHDPS